MTHDLSSTRTLPASPAEVWKAWASASHVKQWWGPHGFTCPVAEVDFREGGTTLVCMSAPQFGDLYNTWTYSLITPHERIEYVLRFSDSTGAPISPPMPGVPDAVPHVVMLTALDDGGTELTVGEFGYASAEAAAMSKGGLDQCLDKLAALYEGATS